MRTIMQDLRYGLRSLAQYPVFTIVAVLSPGVGIGASTSIFSLINELFFRPLPAAVQEQNQLVRLFTKNAKDARLDSFSHPDYQHFSQAPVFSGILAYAPAQQLSLQSGDKVEYIYGAPVSGNFFQLLGVQASVGRNLTPAIRQIAEKPSAPILLQP